jgi:hypothetical protein
MKERENHFPAEISIIGRGDIYLFPRSGVVAHSYQLAITLDKNADRQRKAGGCMTITDQKTQGGDPFISLKELCINLCGRLGLAEGGGEEDNAGYHDQNTRDHQGGQHQVPAGHHIALANADKGGGDERHKNA